MNSQSETILVVDDEPTLSNMLKDILSQQGYRMLEANNGEQALKLLQHNHIDLVISDIRMPGMDGYELVKQIETRFPDTRVQLVSGYSENIDPERVLHKKILFKPFHSEELVERVRALLESDVAR